MKQNNIKVPLQANFFIGDIKSRHDSYSMCPKIFRFGQFVRILWPFKVGKKSTFRLTLSVVTRSLARAYFVTSSKVLVNIGFNANSLYIDSWHLHILRAFSINKNGE